MFKRTLLPILHQLVQHYPVITLMGPRQSGKTTLIQTAFPEKTYINLEAPDLRLAASDDPRYFLSQFAQGAILDEIQRVPELLSYIQVEVDEKKQPGRYILTGSHQLLLHQNITQSLAGRTALLTLLPLSLSELNPKQSDVDTLIWQGFLPRVHATHLEPVHAYRDYFQTYVERDVRLIQNIKDLSVFQNFVRLCAGRVGQVLNKGSLGSELGISDKTVEAWLSLLEASYIIVRLKPYFENFGKRMVKASKLYFTDVGLACYLLGIESRSQLSRDPLRGFLFENMMILDLMKTRLNQGRDPNLYYFRDQHQHEVDVVYKHGYELIPIEIKVSQTYNPVFLNMLHYYQNVVGKERVPKGYLIYTGDHEQQIASMYLTNYMHANTILRAVTK